MSISIKNKKVYILGTGSDIGKALIGFYSDDEAIISGCDRNMKYETFPNWDVLISCIGTMEPIGKFFDLDFNKWKESVLINSLNQLEFIHKIYKDRNKEICNIILFAGGGTNNAVPDYSAYCASKIFLMKMCELIDAEEEKVNIFIVGPGWVKTKIHNQAIKKDNFNYEKTIEFLNNNTGTPMKKIYDLINTLILGGKIISSGRNFSINDPLIVKDLLEDTNKYKLRRYKND